MQTNMRFMYDYILKVYVCVCGARGGLNCMFQQAIARNGGFPRNMSDWAHIPYSGLHYNVLHESQSNRHKIRLDLNWIIFSVSVSIEKSCLPRSEPDPSESVNPVLSVWPTWMLDSIFLALKAICSVIPNGLFSSCGCSLSTGVYFGLHLLSSSPVIGQQRAM